MKIDRLVQACKLDTAVLTSTLGWLLEEIEKVQERSVSCETSLEEIYRLQGEARALRKLRDSLAQKTRMREKDDESAVRTRK